MQSVSSKIWTRVTVSISHDDNHYTTDTYLILIICLQTVILFQILLSRIYSFQTDLFDKKMGPD